MRKILTPDELATVRGSLDRGFADGSAPGWGRELLARALAAGSPMVRHPLGFVCIPVERGTPIGVCLHLWLPTLVRPEPSTSRVHAHSWKLTSHVLCGSLVHDQIQVRQTVHDPTHRVFSVKSMGLLDRLEPTSRLVTQRVAGSQSIPTGTTYELPAGEFHATGVQGMTATMVLAEAANAGPEYTLAAINQAAHSMPRQLCGAREAAAVRAAFGALSNPRPSIRLRGGL